jgi:K+-sensing histidine kinase KdpD
MIFTTPDSSFDWLVDAIEWGAEEEQSALVNLPLLADQVAAEYEDSADQKFVRIKLDVAPDALVIGNSSEFRRVLAHLLAAAVENAPRGSIVSIVGEMSRGVVTLTISDDRYTTTRRFQSDEQFPRGDYELIEGIVATHGGSTQISRSAKDGFSFQLRIPVRA